MVQVVDLLLLTEQAWLKSQVLLFQLGPTHCGYLGSKSEHRSLSLPVSQINTNSTVVLKVLIDTFNF